MTGHNVSLSPIHRAALSRRGLLAGLTTVGVAALAGCGTGGDPLAGPSSAASGGASGATEEIVVGSANFSESQVLGELYSQALTAKGITSSTKSGLGSREVYLGALKDGSISVVPEYTGNLLLYLDENATASTAEEIETALKPLVSELDLALLKPSTAADQDVYCVTAGFSSEKGVMSMDDLKKIAADSVLGGPTELKERSYGPPGLKDVYQATFKQFKPYDSGAVKLKDLVDNKIQVATFFTTESVIGDNGLVQLADPQGLILPQNVVPLVRTTVADNAEAVAVINAVQTAVTTEDLTAMNKQVDGEKKDAKAVAAEYLKTKGLA